MTKSTAINYYIAHLDNGESVEVIIHRYLDGKPSKIKNKKVSPIEREQAFWAPQLWEGIPDDTLQSEAFAYAFTRYFKQKRISYVGLVERVAACAPKVLEYALQHSECFLDPDHLRWKEVCAIGERFKLRNLITACKTLQAKHSLLKQKIEKADHALNELPLVALLTYASLYTFKYILPLSSNPADFNDRITALNELLLRLLAKHKKKGCSESDIEHVFKKHLIPFCFQSPLPKINSDLSKAFELGVNAQLEYNFFSLRDLSIFCHDDNYEFKIDGNNLILSPCSYENEKKWRRDGQKLPLLDLYWRHQANVWFQNSGLVDSVFGRPENSDQKKGVFLKSLQAKMMLREVYGLEDTVSLNDGHQVDLFKAIHSLNSLATHFSIELVEPFKDLYAEHKNFQVALFGLMCTGLGKGGKDRFPIRHYDRKKLVKNIIKTEYSGEDARLYEKDAESIIKFWSMDLDSLSSDSVTGEELFERPWLKVGRFIFVLPTVLTLLNSATATVNNLRRLSDQYRSKQQVHQGETQRIEQRLGDSFENKGFKVISSLELPRNEEGDIGDIDLLCARDGHLFMIEVKSTFVRTTLKSAWDHKINTLRKAGTQLNRKRLGLLDHLKLNRELCSELEINIEDMGAKLHCWIVDTSIEWDHERFSGFLKVSSQELMIALRDERIFIRDPQDWLPTINIENSINLNSSSKNKTLAFKQNTDELSALEESSRLYTKGFNGANFAQVVENEGVWEFQKDEKIDLHNLIFEIPLSD